MLVCTIVAACAAVLWTGLLPAAVSRSDTLPVETTADSTRATTFNGEDVLTTASPVVYPLAGPIALPVALRPVETDTIRPRAITISDGYQRRLTIHRYGSYLMLPLFAGQYVLGQQLLNQKDGVYDGTRRVPIDANLRRTHRTVALGVGTLFVVNTTTGIWNLWEARHDGSHSKRRTAHVLSMLGADAGFVVTGMMASGAVDRRPSDARAHRNVALTSMGLATLGASLMWFH